MSTGKLPPDGPESRQTEPVDDGMDGDADFPAGLPDEYYEEIPWSTRLYESIFGQRDEDGEGSGGSVGGVLGGILLFLGSFVLLFWNEGRAVKTARDLGEGQASVAQLSPEKVDPANDGRLVHVTGLATTAETLTDPEFGVSVNALRLTRKVEVYQWKEKKETKTEKKAGGGEVKHVSYSYDKEWSPVLIDSDKFEQKSHTNPRDKPFADKSVLAAPVKLGDYTLTPPLVEAIGGAEPVAPKADALPKETKEKVKISGTTFYLGASPENPAVGDARVTIAATKPAEISVVARQSGGGLEPYDVPGTWVMLGKHTAKGMFQAAEDSNTTLTWVLRVVGFGMMAVGLYLVMNPLVVLAEFVPYLGDVLAYGAAVISGLVALCLSLLTISVGWVFYRPLVGIPLALLGVGGLVGMVMLSRGKRGPAGPTRSK